MKNKQKQRALGVFTLAMINVSAILSLRNLSIMADVGWASLFFYAAAGIGFFIPAALVSAELATGWPSTGGVFTWVKEAFGPQWGFLAIWLQWIENVIWYPTVLSFTAATISYLINPEWANNPHYILLIILIAYWGCTLVDAFGMRASGMISSIGVIAGTLVPGAIILCLGIYWILSSQPSQITFKADAMVPDMSRFSNLVFLTGVMLGLAGIEMSAVHARDVVNPRKNYPRAIFLSSLIILSLSTLGSISIAYVVPREELSLIAGVMQTFTAFFEAFGVAHLIPWMAGLIAMGSLAMVTTWIIGPSRGLLETAKEGLLPPLFHYRNKIGMPIAIMVIQGIIVTLLSSAFLFMPNVNASFWILTDLTAMLYLIMYMILFLAGIKLRYKHPDTFRAYRIPGPGNSGMWGVALLGLGGSLFAFVIGFIPPHQIDTGELWRYLLFLTVGVGGVVAAPFLIYRCRKEGWRRVEEEY